MTIVSENYVAKFILENDNAETVGEISVNCSSPAECFEVTKSTVENSDIQKIFNADCIPDYSNYEYQCLVLLNYNNGSRAYILFTDKQIDLYYQDEIVIEYMEDWYNGVVVYHIPVIIQRDYNVTTYHNQ